MIINLHKSCEQLISHAGHKPKIAMVNWKRYNFGLFKMWLKYEYYKLYDNNGYPVSNAIIDGKHLNQIEIKWIWKKRQ